MPTALAIDLCAQRLANFKRTARQPGYFCFSQFSRRKVKWSDKKFIRQKFGSPQIFLITKASFESSKLMGINRNVNLIRYFSNVTKLMQFCILEIRTKKARTRETKISRLKLRPENKSELPLCHRQYFPPVIELFYICSYPEFVPRAESVQMK